MKKAVSHNPRSGQRNWRDVAKYVLTSRIIDHIEETELAPAKKINYQFSSRGHELAQVLLGMSINHPHDGAGVYYRSRPFVLTQGLTAEETFAASMSLDGSPTRGRDIGVVHCLPSRGKCTVMPSSGDVGAQYSPAVGWAQAIRYHQNVLNDKTWDGAISVALGGDGSTATNGFWAALNIATTIKLPMLFFIEDNGYAISVPTNYQTAGENIARNLASFKNLFILEGDGTNPDESATRIESAVKHVRDGGGPCLLRLTVPRLCGHSFVDKQAYKSAARRAAEDASDPLGKLEKYLVPKILSAKEWKALEDSTEQEVQAARDAALQHPEPDPAEALRFVMSEPGVPQRVGGLAGNNIVFASSTSHEHNESKTRINLIDAVRLTLESELRSNNRLMVFGEDVGVKGGVHGATVDLQVKFGDGRVFDTSLNEEGIIGRSVGLALAGLVPVPEIQFRKYADPATEQINDCGTMRWRTANTFAAPMVIRMPIGFGKRTGDPWHSVSAEAVFAHTLGWRLAFPSNAEDAAGLLRAALRGNDPTIFFEHRALLDTLSSRRPYPGDNFILEFGKAAIIEEGTALTVVSWGVMLHRCHEAAAAFPGQIELIDLRTLAPWDQETILNSVRKTGRCLIVHEDTHTVGFGAEIAATVTQHAFASLDAPVTRLTTADCVIPYNAGLMAAVAPGVPEIGAAMKKLLAW